MTNIVWAQHPGYHPDDFGDPPGPDIPPWLWALIIVATIIAVSI